VNQTLVRSINTSVVAMLPVASILFIGAFLLGAGTLKDIALALLVGIAAGTYSSIFIASPLLVDLRRREPEIRAQEQRVFKRRAEAGLREEPVPVGASVTASGSLAESGAAGPVPARGGGSGSGGAGSSRAGSAGAHSAGSDASGTGTTAAGSGRAGGSGGATGAVPSTPNPGGQRRQPRKGGRSRPGGKRR